MGVGAGLYIYDVVVKNFTFAISSLDEFLSWTLSELVFPVLVFQFEPKSSSFLV